MVHFPSKLFIIKKISIDHLKKKKNLYNNFFNLKKGLAPRTPSALSATLGAPSKLRKIKIYPSLPFLITNLAIIICYNI